jgi:hypothetical protein
MLEEMLSFKLLSLGYFPKWYCDIIVTLIKTVTHKVMLAALPVYISAQTQLGATFNLY